MLSIFSCAFWPSVCLPWRNVYLDLLPIFWLGCLGFLILSCMSCLYILEINLLEKYLFRSSAHFLIGLFGFFLMLSCMSCLYILEINLLSFASFANSFSRSIGFLFIMFMVSFAMQKFLSLITSHLFTFAYISFALGDRSKKEYCCDLCQRVFCLYFPLRVL